MTELSREFERFDPSVPIESAWTPPASWYTSPEVYAHEQCAVFGRSWQPVARVADLAEPGDYASGILAGQPWVVTRGEDGVLRGFANTCRHKGREVVQGCGHAEKLVCGYHAWSYGLDGRLKSAPRMAGIQDFDREDMSLPPLAVREWGPWVMLNMDPAASDLEAQVASLNERFDAYGWGGLTYVSGTTWDIECNWKVYVDNYLDGGYHIPHMHPTLDAQIDMSTYRTELFERSSLQTTGVSASTDDRIDFEAASRIGEGALYAWLFPNFMINRYGGCMDTNLVVPLGPDRCRVVYEFFFEETTGAEAERFIAESIEQSAVTQREDIAICESVQLGLKSRSYDRGRYAPEVEQGEHHFHGLLARAYTEQVAREEGHH